MLTIKPETAIKYALELKRHCKGRDFCNDCPFYKPKTNEREKKYGLFCRIYHEYPCDWELEKK